MAQLLAHGLINMCDAPAEPTRSSFPAFIPKLNATAPTKNALFIFIIELFISNQFFNY
jgi:hypothetical protein